MFKKGEICIVNESGANYFNSYSKEADGIEIKDGDKVVCRENSSAPFCTPIDKVAYSGFMQCENTWALDDETMQSTGEFMELD